MPSPFPGMNPWLEQDDVWQDFHQSLIPILREIIADQVRPKYLVKIDEHLYLHELPEGERGLLGRGDVTVADHYAAESKSPTGTSIAAPAYGRLPVVTDALRQSYLEIRDRQSRELVTVLEVLSPTNKRSGPDREQFLAKRRGLMQSPVHYVEFDLLRGGPRMPVDNLPPCDYYALVSLARERPRVGIWPIRLRDPMPKVPIPLRDPDPPVHVDLQEALNRVYDAAGYEDYIYSGRPQPPLTADDEEWAREILPKGV